MHAGTLHQPILTNVIPVPDVATPVDLYGNKWDLVEFAAGG